MDLRHTEDAMNNSNETLINTRQNNSNALELKSGDSVKKAICSLYEKNESGALIVDTASARFLDRYIGFIDFSDEVLWCLEEYEKETNHEKHDETGEAEDDAGIFAIFDRCPNSWIENEVHVAYVYGDQSIAEAFHFIWKSRTGVIAVPDRENNKLLNPMLRSDTLLHDREVTVEELIQMESDERGTDLTVGHLRLQDNLLPTINSPVTNTTSDTLKRVMEYMAETGSDFCFLVDEKQQAIGVVSFRDVKVQFAPPCIDSNIHGGGFFESALQTDREPRIE